MILTAKGDSNPSATVSNSTKKFMSVKILLFKITSVAKRYSDIRGYFAKQQQFCIFYLTAESRILQYCLCQELYYNLIYVYYIPAVHSDYYESLSRSCRKIKSPYKAAMFR